MFLTSRKKKNAIKLLISAAFLVVLGLASGAIRGQFEFFFIREKNGRSLEFIQEVFQDVAPTVAYISSASLRLDETGQEVMTLGSGSGVIISENGYIITNYHVIADAIRVEVVLADGQHADAKIAAQSPFDDLALLKIDIEGLNAAALGDSDQVRVGQIVFPIGNPGGAQFARSMTMGMISGIDRDVELNNGRMVHLLQTDAAINPGNSGGPLVDCNGRVIGINTIKIVDPEFESMGFAIPSNTAVRILSEFCPEAFLTGENLL